MGPRSRSAQAPTSLLQTGAQAGLKGAAAEAENLEAIRKNVLTRLDKTRILRSLQPTFRTYPLRSRRQMAHLSRSLTGHRSERQMAYRSHSQGV